MKSLIILLPLALLMAACTSTGIPSLPKSDGDRAKLRATTEMTTPPSEPISLEAASHLAREYFHTFFGDCGVIDGPIEHDDVWTFSTAVGFAGTRGPQIVVAKSGICVFSRGGAPIFWIDGKWRFDPSKYRSFFRNEDVEGDTPKKG